MTVHNLEIKITLKYTSADVLCAIGYKLGCGTVTIENRKTMTPKWHVTNLEDIINKIIPFFDANPLITSKQ